MGDIEGGLARGTAFKGNLVVGCVADLSALSGWTGGSLFLSAVDTQGNSLSRAYVGDTLGTRKDDEPPAAHLFEFGLEQSLFAGDVDLKAGQIAVTDDFFHSFSGFFTHNAFNWGPNGASGAPAGPDSAFGLRAHLKCGRAVYLTAGAYDNSVQGDGHAPRWDFPAGGKAVLFVETGWANADAPNPSRLSLGAWTSRAPRMDNEGGGLLRGNCGSYLVAEHTVSGLGESGGHVLRAFVRLACSPADRNQFGEQADAGVLYSGLLPGREADTVGAGFAQAATSASWRTAHAAGAGEQAVEVKYQVRAAPWCTVEFFAQRILHPGLPDGRHLRDAQAIGVADQFTL